MQKRALIEVVFVAAILSGVGFYVINQNFLSKVPVHLLNSICVPPPSTTRSTFARTNVQPVYLANGSSFNFTVQGTRLDLTFYLQENMPIKGCSFSKVSVTTPVACGSMCGGEIGDIEYYSNQLRANLSSDKIENFNATLSSDDSLSTIFPYLALQIEINGQGIEWNGYPPACSEGGPSGQIIYSSFECMQTPTLRITFAMPTVTNSYQLVFNSSETLIP